MAFFTWDDEITQDASEFEILMPGEYAFEVTKVERMKDTGSGKFSGCPYANVTMKVTSGTTSVPVSDRLYLAEEMEWKLSSFLTALGLKKHGESIRINRILNSVGEKGRLTIEVQGDKASGYQTYTDDQDIKARLKRGETLYNKVKGYKLPKGQTEEKPNSKYGFSF